MSRGSIIVVRDRFPNGQQHAYKAVVMPVSKADLARGVNAQKRGLFAFYGLCPGEPPCSISSYGKIIPARGRRVGRLRASDRRSLRYLGLTWKAPGVRRKSTAASWPFRELLAARKTSETIE